MATFNTNTSTAAKPANKNVLYANIGMMLDVPQEDGSVENQFVSIPVGLALDNLKPMPIRGKNEQWNELVSAKNAILQLLQDTAYNLNPGEGQVMSTFVVEARHASDENVAPTSRESKSLLAQIKA